MKTRYAFFDVDGTLLKMNSMLSFMEYFFHAYHGNKKGKIKSIHYAWRRKWAYRNYSREALNSAYYKNFSGIEEARLMTIGKQWFIDKVLSINDPFYNAVLSELRWHQQTGAHVVLVSGGFRGSLGPLAEHLNIKTVLCVEPEVRNGKLSGKIASPQTIGKGKVLAIEQFLKTQLSSQLSQSYAYGDHSSDLPMLKLVDHPVVVGKDAELLKAAHQFRWKIIT